MSVKLVVKYKAMFVFCPLPTDTDWLSKRVPQMDRFAIAQAEEVNSTVFGRNLV